MKTSVSAARAALFAIITSLFSSAQAQDIRQSTDSFTGTITYNTPLRDVDLEGGSFFSERYVSFRFGAFKPVPAPDTPYVLTVMSFTPEWVFIGAGESLILKLNGSEMMPLRGTGSLNSRKVLSADSLLEVAGYPVTPDQLSRIANAKTIDFRILGERQTITGSWDAKLIADAGAFLSQGPQLLGLAAQPAQPATGTLPPPQASSAGSPVISAGGLKVGVVVLPMAGTLSSMLKLPSAQGVYVAFVQPGSIADKAHIVAGDVILQCGTTAITSTSDLASWLPTIKPGASVPVTVWRSAAKTTLNLQF